MNNQPHIPLPSMSVLRCFDAAARHESFTAAAQELGMTQGALSRQVKELEQHVGAALFRREGRGVRLTEGGRSLARHVAGDLDRLRSTISHAVAGGDQHEILTIAAPPTFAARWLVPRLQAFKARRPNLEVFIISRSDPFELTAEKVDVAIHFGRDNWPGAALAPLCPENLVVVAAPCLLSDTSSFAPDDLQQQPLLHNASRSDVWPKYFESQGLGTTTLRTGSYFDQLGLIIAAATAGMGFAILPTYLIEAELAAGQLVALAPVTLPSQGSYFVAQPLGVNNALALEFQTWVASQVSS